MRGEPVGEDGVLEVLDAVVAHSAAGHLGNGGRVLQHGPGGGQGVDEDFSAVGCQHVRDHL